MIVGVLVLCQCGKDDPEPEPEPIIIMTNDYSNYWGCWGTSEYDTIIDSILISAYDIILTENTPEPHRFEFAVDCVPISIGPMDIGVFRNDTLILDNGIFEYWCFIVDDTMYYSAYVDNAQEVKYTKN